ncbi:NUDIX domain-containing protein [Aggregatilineales bacterium SYSU G02658]
MAKHGKIRVLALAALEHVGHLFVSEGYDRVTGEVFYRPLGGRVEFGEYGAQAVVREFQEELQQRLIDVRYLGLCESLFTYEGQPAHEVVLVYRARFADAALYDLARTLEARDGDRLLGVASWQPLARFQRGEARLYPVGLLALLSLG